MNTKQKLTSILKDVWKEEVSITTGVEEILSEFDVKEKQPDQIADEEKENPWEQRCIGCDSLIGNIHNISCPTKGESVCVIADNCIKPKQPKETKPSEVHCTFCGYPKKGNGCRECKPSEEKSWVGEFAPNGGHDPHNPFPLKPSVQECEHDFEIEVAKVDACVKCGLVGKPKPKFEIEELQLWENEGATDRDDENIRDIQNKINQIISYLREHHELIK